LHLAHELPLGSAPEVEGIQGIYGFHFKTNVCYEIPLLTLILIAVVGNGVGK